MEYLQTPKLGGGSEHTMSWPSYNLKRTMISLNHSRKDILRLLTTPTILTL